MPDPFAKVYEKCTKMSKNQKSNVRNVKKSSDGVNSFPKNTDADSQSAGSGLNLCNSKIAHCCFIQPETKKKKTSSVEEEEEVPKNGCDVSAFFDTECRQGEREQEDEPVEESLQESPFFDFVCRQENGSHKPNLCIVQNEAGDE